MRRYRALSSIAIALAGLGVVLANVGDLRAASKQPFDVKLMKPAITITHQNPNSGTCFGGTTEPCDVFQFTSKFSCTDCALDLGDNSSSIFLDISTSSNCFDTEIYSAFLPVPNFSVQMISKNKATLSFPATLQGSNGRDFILFTLQLNGHSGTITMSGNADFHALTGGAVFVGLRLGGDSVLDSDEPADFVCTQVTPTFQNLN